MCVLQPEWGYSWDYFGLDPCLNTLEKYSRFHQSTMLLQHMFRQYCIFDKLSCTFSSLQRAIRPAWLQPCMKLKLQLGGEGARFEKAHFTITPKPSSAYDVSVEISLVAHFRVINPHYLYSLDNFIRSKLTLKSEQGKYFIGERLDQFHCPNQIVWHTYNIPILWFSN